MWPAQTAHRGSRLPRTSQTEESRGARGSPCSPVVMSSSSVRSAQRGDGLVERGGRPHHRGGLHCFGAEVAADVGGLALHGEQLLDDHLLVVARGARERGERGGEVIVLSLRRELLGPVEG